LREIQAMQQEKASFTPAQRKLDSQLVFALKQNRNEPVANGQVPQLRIGVQADAYGMVRVDIGAKVTANLLQEIQNHGGTITDNLPQSSPIRALVPLGQLEGIAALADVKFIRHVIPPLVPKEFSRIAMMLPEPPSKWTARA
jgi:hypothetical protein